jgi:hypothetical protein
MTALAARFTYAPSRRVYSSCAPCAHPLVGPRPTAEQLALILSVHAFYAEQEGDCGCYSAPTVWERVRSVYLMAKWTLMDAASSARAKTVATFAPLAVAGVVLAVVIGEPAAWALGAVPTALAVAASTVLAD